MWWSSPLRPCLRGAKQGGRYNKWQYLMMELCYAESCRPLPPLLLSELSGEEAQSSHSPGSVWWDGKVSIA